MLCSGESWGQVLLKVVEEGRNAKDGNWKNVGAAVMKSQPPRPLDVPSMIDYVKLWGGMPSGMHVTYLVRLVSLTSNATLLDKTIFSAFSGLKYKAVDGLPTHFITAAVVATATAEDAEMKPLTVSEIRGLDKGKALLVIATVNPIFARLFNVYKDENDHSKLCLLMGLMRDLVFIVVGRKEMEGKQIEDVVTEFSAAMERGPDDPSSTSAATSASSADPSDTSVAAATITYDADGVATGTGKMTLESKGYLMGQYIGVKKRKDVPDDDSLFLLSLIDDNGTAHLTPANKDGTMDEVVRVRVSLEDMLRSYEPRKHGYEVNTSYPNLEPYKTDENRFAALRGMVLLGLEEMVYAHPPPNVRIMKLPTRSVQAVQSYTAGTLKIVPSTTVVVDELNPVYIKTLQETRVAFEIGFTPVLDGQPTYFLKQYNSKTFMSPFWTLDISDEKEKCNMELQPYVVTAKRAVHQHSKKANPNTEITFQIAVSTQYIKAGETLVLYKYLGEKKKSVNKEVTLERKVKKPKVV